MIKAVISGIGPDQPGIVAAISHILFRYGCNIEDSTMTRLAQEFAVILIITIPDAVPFSTIQQECTALEDSHNLMVLLKPIPQHLDIGAHRAQNPYMVSVAGNDDKGITFHISRKLAEMDINILDLNSQIIPGEDGPVYVMMVEVDVPSTIAVETVNAELQELAKAVNVEIKLRPLEAVAL